MYDDGLIYDNVDVRDVQKALGTSKRDWGELCSHNNINKWAKYKPIRSQKREQLTYTDFLNDKFGLVIPDKFSAIIKNPTAIWQYNKVRPWTDWSRITDFKNYDVKAVAPFAFEVSGELGSSIGAWFYADSGVNSLYGSGRHWKKDTCISVYELVEDGYQNMYITFTTLIRMTVKLSLQI